MNEIKIKNKMAFTLAETLIALVILGIIAVVTIPTLIRNHVDNANRAKVKKAMSMYEKALNNMIIENDLRSTDAIRTFGTTDAQGNESTTCPQTNPYFKTVEGANCRFKTADGVWWDITDITNPIIILKSDYKEYPLTGDDDTALQKLAQGTDKFVYGMVGRYEDDKGILRINDNAYENQHGSNAQKAEVAKLWDFINNQTSGGNAGGGEGGGDEQGVGESGETPTASIFEQNCSDVEVGSTCTIGDNTFTKVSLESANFDRDGDCTLEDTDICDYLAANSATEAGDYYIINTESDDPSVCASYNASPANAAQLQQLNGSIECSDCLLMISEVDADEGRIGFDTMTGGLLSPATDPFGRDEGDYKVICIGK